MERQKRAWHPRFQEYMKFIVNHPNYAGMPHPYKDDGSIRWVVLANSDIGKERMAWWDKKRESLGIPREKGCWARVARAIHPTGKKPCQICGKEMSLDYVYPNKRGGLSPGAMSDVPDRFDGYHTYNICCRSIEDTGRHKENLMRYGQDRRAYENWAEGDWKAADWLMQVFRKHGLSPDHIGPLSLGFSHRPKFKVTSLKENIDKRNVMSYQDVQSLLVDEQNGEKVISWHSKFLWDKIKTLVKNDDGAMAFSKVMRKNLHYVLIILSDIKSNGFAQFLVKNFLHPEYAFCSIEFVNFDPKTGRYDRMIKKAGNIKQYRNNAERYIRISLESLDEYQDKENRRVKKWDDKEVDQLVQLMLQCLRIGNESGAIEYLNKALQKLADDGLNEYLSLTKSFF